MPTSSSNHVKTCALSGWKLKKSQMRHQCCTPRARVPLGSGRRPLRRRPKRGHDQHSKITSTRREQARGRLMSCSTCTACTTFTAGARRKHAQNSPVQGGAHLLVRHGVGLEGVHHVDKLVAVADEKHRHVVACMRAPAAPRCCGRACQCCRSPRSRAAQECIVTTPDSQPSLLLACDISTFAPR
jgi:hypothetical protein